MTVAELRLAIENGLGQGAPLWETLARFASEGGRQSDAEAILSEIRATFTEDEDMLEEIDDLLDSVVGWCSPAAQLPWRNT